MKILFVLLIVLYFILCRGSSVSDKQRKLKISSYLRDVFPELYSNQYEGDIFLFGGKIGTKNAVRDPTYRWPNATVPYEIASNFTDEDKAKILKGMARLENETCIRFVPHYDHKQYVFISNKQNAGCFAVIGYHSDAESPHPVNFETPGCMKHQGTIEHEFLHILGLFHEQSRYDRDDHVIIYWGNITEEYMSNFAKVPESDAHGYNVSYDINSVMHYPRHAFSKNGNETIVYKKNPEMKLGQRVGATQGDLEKIRQMYNCRKKEVPYGSPEWFFEQFQSFMDNKNRKPLHSKKTTNMNKSKKFPFFLNKNT